MFQAHLIAVFQGGLPAPHHVAPFMVDDVKCFCCCWITCAHS